MDTTEPKSRRSTSIEIIPGGAEDEYWEKEWGGDAPYYPSVKKRRSSNELKAREPEPLGPNSAIKVKPTSFCPDTWLGKLQGAYILDVNVRKDCNVHL